MNIQIKYIDFCALLFLSIILVSGVFFIYHTHGKAQKKIQLEQRLLSKGKNDLNMAENNLDRLQGVLAQSRTFLERLNRKIPGSAGIGNLLTTIYDQINQQNIVLTRFSHQPPVKESRYERIALDFTLEGRFLDLYQLVHYLETMDRVFIIDSLKITGPQKQDLCRIELAATVFQE